MIVTDRITVQSVKEQTTLSSGVTKVHAVDKTNPYSNRYGGKGVSLTYKSPVLDLGLSLTSRGEATEGDRVRQGHFLWKPSMHLTEVLEAASLRLNDKVATPICDVFNPDSAAAGAGGRSAWDVSGLTVLEVGAGFAVPSMISAHMGARRVVAADYPEPAVMRQLKQNVGRNQPPATWTPPRAVSTPILPPTCPVEVTTHIWGDLADNGFSACHKGAFDRFIAAGCLWLGGDTHPALAKSIAHFMNPQGGRCLLTTGLLGGRGVVRDFFSDPSLLKANGLETVAIWERNVKGEMRPWKAERGPVEQDGDDWCMLAVVKHAADKGEASTAASVARAPGATAEQMALTSIPRAA